MRIFRLVATPLLLLALLGLLAWGALWGWQNLTAPLPEPEPTPCVTVTADLVTVTDVSVRVYNAGFTSGLANRVSARLEDAGFTIIKVHNTDERVTAGVVIRTNEDNQPGLRLISSYFQDVTVEYDDRVDGTVDVLLSSDEPVAGAEPLFQVSSGKAGTTCIPPTASPEASTPTTTPVQEP